MHDSELTPIIQGWFDSHTRGEVFAAAQEAGLPGAPVLNVDEIMRDEHFVDRGYFVEIGLGETRGQEKGACDDPRRHLREVICAPLGEDGQILEEPGVRRVQGKSRQVQFAG